VVPIAHGHTGLALVRALVRVLEQVVPPQQVMVAPTVLVAVRVRVRVLVWVRVRVRVRVQVRVAEVASTPLSVCCVPHQPPECYMSRTQWRTQGHRLPSASQMRVANSRTRKSYRCHVQPWKKAAAKLRAPHANHRHGLVLVT